MNCCIDFRFILKAVNGCDFFEWYEVDFIGISRNVITDFNHRRIFLEEKLKLVEENLAVSNEKKKALKEEKKKLIEESLVLQEEWKEDKEKLIEEIENLGRYLKLC